jgi:hypothetical protein
MVWVALPVVTSLVGALLIILRGRSVVAEARALQRALASVSELRQPLLDVASDARALSARASELRVPARPALPPAP